MARRSYETDRIRVHWNSDLCIHSAICLNSLPQVFDVRRRPWVDVTAADADAIARTVERCPSSALTYEWVDGSPGERSEEATSLVPWPNGPLMVRGRVEVRDAGGELFAQGTRFSLCRCGASQNQPFCDLSHRRIGFRNNPRVITGDRESAQSPYDISPRPGI